MWEIRVIITCVKLGGEQRIQVVDQLHLRQQGVVQCLGVPLETRNFPHEYASLRKTETMPQEDNVQPNARIHPSRHSLRSGTSQPLTGKVSPCSKQIPEEVLQPNGVPCHGQGAPNEELHTVLSIENGAL